MDHEAAPGTSHGARCALHGDALAVIICSRCGNFACEACRSEADPPLCRPCLARVGHFSMQRDEATVTGVVELAYELFRRHWPLLTLATVLVVGVSSIIGFAASLLQIVMVVSPTLGLVLSVFGNLLQIVVQTALQLGVFRMTLDAALGRPVELRTLSSQLDKLPKALLQVLVVMLALLLPLTPLVFVGVWLFTGGVAPEMAAFLPSAIAFALVCVVALVLVLYVGLGLSFVQLELVYENDISLSDAFRRSWRIADGKRWLMCGVFLVASVLAMAGLCLCCVGYFVTVGFGTLMLSVLFLALRRGAIATYAGSGDGFGGSDGGPSGGPLDGLGSPSGVA